MSAVTLAYSIDLEKLWAPISPEQPAGESLSYEGTYDRIQAARREDDPRLSQGIYTTDLKRADWETVERICLEALGSRSKDLRIAGWFLEAAGQLRGFTGVGEGLNLITGLCEKFWADLYPKLEGDNLEDRVAPFEWINEKLTLKLKQISITQPHGIDVALYSFVDWESACHLANLASKDAGLIQQAQAQGKPTLTSFQASVLATDISYYVTLFAELNLTLDGLAALEKLLDERCGRQSPSLHQFREAIESVQQLIAEILRSSQQGLIGAEEDPETHLDASFSEQESESLSGGAIRSRAQAYHMLAEAADYLIRTEPHSPVPYLVKRAVDWGNMDLFEVFKQIIRNDTEMEEIDKLLRLSKKEGG
jgi:type VI secretion system protein ImpA